LCQETERYDEAVSVFGV